VIDLILTERSLTACLGFCLELLIIDGAFSFPYIELLSVDFSTEEFSEVFAEELAARVLF
jgi:hypothetical protein